MSLPLVIIPLTSILISDFLKFIIQSIRHKKIDITWMFHSWWMPSWHSAFASSVITVTFLEKWSTWTEFMLAVVFWILVMYDARWIRMEASKHAKILNHIQNKTILDECLWHTTFEVICWASLWILISYFLWKTQIFWWSIWIV